MSIWSQEKYIHAWNFASHAHATQLAPGTELPYINHIANVAMEVMSAIANNSAIQNPDLAVQCALLHDIIEDTDFSFNTVSNEFGDRVASGVLALTKNKELPTKEEQMKDSLARIKKQPVEVWMVKMGDRITNLQPPPSHWNKEKINRYHDEAKSILEALGIADDFLASRLRRKIEIYGMYC